MTTIAIPAEGLAEEFKHTSAERVLTMLPPMHGKTVRSLVYTSLDSNTIYAFREDRAKKGVTRIMRLQVSLVLNALRRLERLGLISRKEADPTSQAWRYHEDINPLLAPLLDKALDQEINGGFARGWPRTIYKGLLTFYPELEGITSSELHLTPEGKKLAEAIWRNPE